MRRVFGFGNDHPGKIPFFLQIFTPDLDRTSSYLRYTVHHLHAELHLPLLGRSAHVPHSVLANVTVQQGQLLLDIYHEMVVRMEL